MLQNTWKNRKTTFSILFNFLFINISPLWLINSLMMKMTQVIMKVTFCQKEVIKSLKYNFLFNIFFWSDVREEFRQVSMFIQALLGFRQVSYSIFSFGVTFFPLKLVVVRHYASVYV